MLSKATSLLGVVSLTSFASSLGPSNNVNDVNLPSFWANPEDDSMIEQTLSSSLQGALSTIRSVQELPSCNKMAAATLIHSCATLESPMAKSVSDMSPGWDMLLDESKKIYAARLAVCELDDAKVLVPRQCQSFLPTIRTAKKRTFKGMFSKDGPSKPQVTYPEYEDLTEENLDACLSALHDYGSGQGWTSYSNNKKHAVAMCHAVRGELEKDEQIHLFKILTSTTVDIQDALSRSKQEWDVFRSDFQKLKSGVRQFHVDLYGEDAQRQQAVKDLWTEVERRIQEGLSNVGQSIQQLQYQTEKTGDSINGNRERMEDVFAEALEQFRALAVKSKDTMGVLSEDATSLSDVIAFVAESLQQGVVKGAYEASNSIAQTNELAVATNDRLAQYFAQIGDSSGLVAGMVFELASIKKGMRSIHEGNTQRQIELQTLVNQTKDALEMTSVEAGRLHSVISFWADIFENGVYGTLPYIWALVTFMLNLIISTLVVFAACKHLLGIGFFSTCCIAIATGLGKMTHVLLTPTLANSFAGLANLVTFVIDFSQVWDKVSTTLQPTAGVILAFFGGMASLLIASWSYEMIRSYFIDRASRSTNADLTRYSANMNSVLSEKEAISKFRLPVNNPRFFEEALKKSFPGGSIQTKKVRS